MDWRDKLRARDQRDVFKELEGAVVRGLDGGRVLLELASGEFVWYGAVGPEYDLEIDGADPVSGYDRA